MESFGNAFPELLEAEKPALYACEKIVIRKGKRSDL